MRFKPGIGDLLRMGVGAALMLVLVLLALHYQIQRNPGRQIALKAGKIDLVERMRFSLAAASEAEKSAVLAVTDDDSLAFADQARAATAEVERLRHTLAQLLASDGMRKEKELLASFSEVFTDFQRVDRELLALAVKNTNIKAFALAFGPAAQAAKEADSALSRFLARHATSPQSTLLLAAGAQAAILRLQTRLAPHIAEQSDPKMDELEALMAKDDREIRAALDGLAAPPSADPDLVAARSSYAQFSEVRTQILALSRENTNVRSLAISLDQKRKAMSMCQEALYALQQEIAGEPAPVAPTNPRRMRAEPRSTEGR